MLRYLLAILILVGLLLIFFIQNAGFINIHFILWEMNVSLSWLTVVWFVMGAMAGVLLSLIPVHHRKRKARKAMEQDASRMKLQ